MNAPAPRRSIWRRLFGLVLWLLVMVVIGLGALCLYTYRDRNPGYTLNVRIDGAKAMAQPQVLGVGFGRVKINPDLSHSDQPIWLAGFGEHRAATLIHDDLWAIACVLDDGYSRIGIVALDSIGFFHDDVITVRQRLGAHLKLDYTVICSTHNHSTPDLMGLWGPNHFQTGVNSQYRDQVVDACVRALSDAVGNLQPGRVAFHEIPLQPEGLLTDTRKPIVYDSTLRMMLFTHQVDGSVLGSIIGWADHPETPWSQNTEITADFPGYVRTALEKGVSENGKLLQAGLGGVHLYINGAIGGLMTTSPSVTVHDPYNEQDYSKPGHDKARALGRQLAAHLFAALKAKPDRGPDHIPISVQAETLDVPLANKLFMLAPILGVIDRGHPGIDHWNKLRTEVALLGIGDASIACIPGELYPEIANGGIERAPGGDFDVEPVEVPSIRELMPGKFKFVFGLANDEIGYIIPKSEWDEKPPYIYGASKPVYGEINSVGPDVARTLHSAIRQLCATASAPGAQSSSVEKARAEASGSH